MKTIGSCSLCGGPVQVPRVWMSIFPPTPECSDCHAVSSGGNGPVIPMKQVPPVRPYTGDNGLGSETRLTKR